jgi:hypothetical protein
MTLRRRSLVAIGVIEVLSASLHGVICDSGHAVSTMLRRVGPSINI